MKKSNKLIILTIFFITLFVAIAIYYHFTLLQFDNNNDGKVDLYYSTNLFYLIKKIDIDHDGVFDLKEYITYRKRIKKLIVLNDKYDDIKIEQVFQNGDKCIITKNMTCDYFGEKVRNVRYKHNGKTIMGFGKFDGNIDDCNN